MAAALAGNHISGNGPFTKQAEGLLRNMLGGQCDVLFTTSCTHALEMSALLLDLQPGDEVILPSFTFVSTANAYALRGASLKFVDIRSDTLNMDEQQVAAAITERTKAIVPVHYAGVGCDMAAIMKTADQAGVVVIEDAAHALAGSYQGKALGTLGQMAALSFHETKNFSCGEGGALVINDRKYKDRAEILREKGTDRSQFFRGVVDKYTWRDVGSSYVASDLLAAFLVAQLQAAETIQAKRRDLWDRYHEAFAPLEASGLVRRPIVPNDRQQAYHMYYLLMQSQAERDHLISHLKEAAISAVFHYMPLHSSPMGQLLGGDNVQLPVTDEVSARLVRLPFFAGLDPYDQERVISRVLEVMKGATQ